MNVEERNKIVEENLGLIGYSLSKLGVKYNNEDYYQQGVLELIRCVENFDETRGCKFSTYATTNIIFKLKEYIIRDFVIKPKRTGNNGQVFTPDCDSLQRPIQREVPHGRDILLGDIIPDCKDVFEMTEVMVGLKNLVDKKLVKKKDMDIFLAYCYHQKRKADIARKYKITSKEVSDIVVKTQKRIREFLI